MCAMMSSPKTSRFSSEATRIVRTRYPAWKAGRSSCTCAKCRTEERGLDMYIHVILYNNLPYLTMLPGQESRSRKPKTRHFGLPILLHLPIPPRKIAASYPPFPSFLYGPVRHVRPGSLRNVRRLRLYRQQV